MVWKWLRNRIISDVLQRPVVKLHPDFEFFLEYSKKGQIGYGIRNSNYLVARLRARAMYAHIIQSKLISVDSE